MSESLEIAKVVPDSESSRNEVNEIDDSMDDSIESLLASGIVQQLTRTHALGADQITGIFRCDFAPHQDRYALNIPIHPALSEIPSVEANALESDFRIRVTDRQKFGVRLEVILNQPTSQPQQLFVDVVIVSCL